MAVGPRDLMALIPFSDTGSAMKGLLYFLIGISGSISVSAENVCRDAFVTRLQQVCNCEVSENEGRLSLLIDTIEEDLSGEWAWLFEYNLYAYESGLPILRPTPNLPNYPDRELRQQYLKDLGTKRQFPITLNSSGLPIFSMRLDRASRDGKPLYFESEIREISRFRGDDSAQSRWVLSESYDERQFQGEAEGETVVQLGRQTREFHFDLTHQGDCQLSSLQVHFTRIPIREHRFFSADECEQVTQNFENLRGPREGPLRPTDESVARVHGLDCMIFQDLLKLNERADQGLSTESNGPSIDLEEEASESR
ncbi:MAG: hypothetical protein AAF202_08260 [Pseudomonadota bacterium]